MSWLCHSKGPWKKHKYIAKVGEGEEARYYYTNDEITGFNNELVKFTPEEKEAIDHDLTERDYREQLEEAQHHLEVEIEGKKLFDDDPDKLEEQIFEAANWLENNAQYYSDSRLYIALTDKIFKAYLNNGLNYVENSDRDFLNERLDNMYKLYGVKRTN